MSTIVRANWSNVTLGQFAALNVLRQPDAIDQIHAYWDWLHTHPSNMFPGDEPTRLTAEGEAWVKELQNTIWNTLDENEEIAAGKEFLRRMGTMLVINVDKRLERPTTRWS